MIRLSNTTKPTDAKALKKAERGFDQLITRTDVGFFRLNERDDLWKLSQSRGQELAGTYDRLCVIGMGGSSLGGLAIRDGLADWKTAKQLEFFDNVDASRFWDKIDSFDGLEKTHWLIISKSGGTLEILTLASFVQQHLKSKGIELKDHASVVSSDNENPLTNWAHKNEVSCFEIPLDVGGRFSVLTPVGLILASFLGVDLSEMKSGATWARDQRGLVCELSAQSLQSFESEKWITLFWTYSDSLKTFGYWAQQLWAESLGKAVDLNGAPAPRVSSPFVSVGASDQHSILQQVFEGASDKFIWFFRNGEAESVGPRLEGSEFSKLEIMQGRTMGELLAAEATATQQSLAQVGVDSLSLEFEKLGPSELGALFMLFELVVATIGQTLNINTFDQPGVEMGKKLAKEFLSK